MKYTLPFALGLVATLSIAACSNNPEGAFDASEKSTQDSIDSIDQSAMFDDLYKDRGDDLDLILAKKPEGGLEFIQPGYESRAEGTMVLSFCPVKDKDGRGLGAKEPGLAGPAASLPI